MTMTDPIATMLTKIRNAVRQGHSQVDVPASRLKKEIVRLLKSEGLRKKARDRSQVLGFSSHRP